MKIEGVTISRPEKVLFPGSGFTKKDLAEYYGKVADLILPHMKDRPLVMRRFPDGIGEEGFFQKQIPDYFPDWIDRVTVEKEGGEQTLVVCNAKETLIYLANQAAIELHLWLSTTDALDYPDQIVFDLDPPEDDFEAVREAAFALRDLIDNLGLTAYVKTTGSKGVHVIIPIKPEIPFDAVRNFAKDVAQTLSDMYPEKFTTETLKKKRKGRVFLDYLRNSYAQTAIAPYGVRAKRGAPIAAPITWKRLKEISLGPQSFSLKNIPDPWDHIVINSLKDAIDKLN